MQILPASLFVTTGAYTVTRYLQAKLKEARLLRDGSMDLNNFHKEILLNLGALPHSSIIVLANVGTTITGAVDDVPGKQPRGARQQRRVFFRRHFR